MSPGVAHRPQLNAQAAINPSGNELVELLDLMKRKRDNSLQLIEVVAPPLTEPEGPQKKLLSSALGPA